MELRFGDVLMRGSEVAATLVDGVRRVVAGELIVDTAVVSAVIDRKRCALVSRRCAWDRMGSWRVLFRVPGAG